MDGSYHHYLEDDDDDRGGDGNQMQQHQWRRLSYTSPATPFVDTPAGAPTVIEHVRGGGYHHHDHHDDDDNDVDDQKFASSHSGGQQQRQQSHHVQVQSHGHLDETPPAASAAAAAAAAARISGGTGTGLTGLNTRNNNMDAPPPVAVGAAAGVASSAAPAAGAGASSGHAQPYAQGQQPAGRMGPPPPQQPHAGQPQSQAAGHPPHHHPPAATRSTALLSAQYYASCAISSIPPTLADRAVKSVHSAFKYWWDQSNLAERMVGEGDAEVTQLRVERRESEGGSSLGGGSSVASSSVGGHDTAWGGVGGGGGGGFGPGPIMHQHHHNSNRPPPYDRQESMDDVASVASSMSRAAAAVGSAIGSIVSGRSGRSGNGNNNKSSPVKHGSDDIPRAVTVDTSSNTESDVSGQRMANKKKKKKRSRTHPAVTAGGGADQDDAGPHGDALWADEDYAKASASANANRNKKQRTAGVGTTIGPSPPPSAQQQHQQPSARTELVRAEMSQFLKQQRYRSELQQTKTALLHALQVTGGDVTTEPFLHALKRLRGLYKRSGLDCRRAVTTASGAAAAAGGGGGEGAPPAQLEGMWLTLSRPNYHDCLGLNPQREYMYTLGRMSFGMYRPTNLVCSVQGVFNPVHVVDVKDRDEVESVPRGLRKELYEGRTLLRTYNIVTAFSIEPPSPLFGENSPNTVVARPIRGIMTTYGYVLPDPVTPNRLSVWFTGGTVEVDDAEADSDEWRRIFGGSNASSADQANHGPMAPPPPGPSLSERAKLLAAKLLLGATVPNGMDEDGSMNFKLRRPVGGHGSAYVDILYLDDTLRIMQGHHGSVYVVARVPGS